MSIDIDKLAADTAQKAAIIALDYTIENLKLKGSGDDPVRPLCNSFRTLILAALEEAVKNAPNNVSLPHNKSGLHLCKNGRIKNWSSMLCSRGCKRDTDFVRVTDLASDEKQAELELKVTAQQRVIDDLLKWAVERKERQLVKVFREPYRVIIRKLIPLTKAAHASEKGGA